MSLDFEPEELRRILYKTSDTVVEIFRGMRERKVFQAGSPKDVRGLLLREHMSRICSHSGHCRWLSGIGAIMDTFSR